MNISTLKNGLLSLRGLHPLLKDLPKELRCSVADRIAACKEYNFVYVRIPKAANSTVSITLASKIFPQKVEMFLKDQTGNAAKESFESIWRNPLLTKDALLKNFFVFSIFRNPYTRVLSAYLDKLQTDGNTPKFQWVADRMGFSDVKHITFSDFVGFLEAGNLNGNIHWAPQTTICPIRVCDLHYVGKIEQLESDLNLILKRIFGSFHHQTILTRTHNRKHVSKLVGRYYQERLSERVYRLYEKDFDLLKYAKDLP